MRRDWGLTRWLVEARPDWSVPVFEVLALPGDLIVVALVLALVYLASVWGRRDRTEDFLCAPAIATTVAIVFGGLALVVLVESIVGAGRPPAEWHAIDPSPHGFPSGHTMAATVLWGALAWRHWAAPTQYRVLAVGLVVGLVGFSRLGLGVHYLADVIAAVIVGIVYLAIADRITRDRPIVAFGGAILIALAATLVSGISSRAVVAFAGTSIAAIGWYLTERPFLRNRLRGLLVWVLP